MVLGFLVRLSVSWSLGFAILGVGSSWDSHAHPLSACFVSLVLFVRLVFLWRTMGTRPGCDTWVLGWVLGSALGLLISGARGSEAPSSWGSHAHPLVSCFSSLVLFVSLFVISLVVVFVSIIVIMSLRTVQRR